jgi:hypothetical protein
MPDMFQGSGSIVLYSGDINIPLSMRFPPATGSTKNDGAVPYGSTIVSQTALAKYLDDNTSGTTTLISFVASSSHKVTVWLSHSSNVPTGLHSIIATITWDLSGSTRQMTRPFDLDRVFVR